MGNIAMQSSSAGWIEEWTEENLGEAGHVLPKVQRDQPTGRWW